MYENITKENKIDLNPFYLCKYQSQLSLAKKMTLLDTSKFKFNLWSIPRRIAKKIIDGTSLEDLQYRDLRYIARTLPCRIGRTKQELLNTIQKG